MRSMPGRSGKLGGESCWGYGPRSGVTGVVRLGDASENLEVAIARTYPMLRRDTPQMPADHIHELAKQVSRP